MPLKSILAKKPGAAKTDLVKNYEALKDESKVYEFEGVFVKGYKSFWIWIVNILKAVADLETTVSSLDVSEIQYALDEINTTLASIQSTLDDHETRISALENPEPP